jgi:hypothetical protein
VLARNARGSTTVTDATHAAAKRAALRSAHGLALTQPRPFSTGAIPHDASERLLTSDFGLAVLPHLRGALHNTPAAVSHNLRTTGVVCTVGLLELRNGLVVATSSSASAVCSVSDEALAMDCTLGDSAATEVTIVRYVTAVDVCFAGYGAAEGLIARAAISGAAAARTVVVVYRDREGAPTRAACVAPPSADIAQALFALLQRRCGGVAAASLHARLSRSAADQGILGRRHTMGDAASVVPRATLGDVLQRDMLVGVEAAAHRAATKRAQ